MRRRSWTPYLYLLPAAVILLAFSIYPLFHAFNMSLHTDWGRPGYRFVGLGNYRHLLVETGEFLHSLGVTVWYAVGTVPITMILSFLIAGLLFQKLRALGLFRTIYFLPYVTSTVAAAMVWRWIFNPSSYGLANTVVRWLGGEPLRWYSESTGVFQLLADNVDVVLPSWAAGPSLALVCVIVFSIWHALGFNVVIFLAGLSAIPREMYEAAEVDGATGIQRTRYITLPLLSPTLFFLFIISTIRSFQTFNQIYVIARQGETWTRGTEHLTMQIYRHYYTSHDLGAATATAVLLFLIILGLTFLQMRMLGRRVHY
ncbi:MAG: sugar ABC transporter permease [Planctomycetota bacterium]